MELQEVLEVRHRVDGVAEQFIHWKNLLEFEDSWELMPDLMQQFPDAHLEDKVVVYRGVVLETSFMARSIVGRVEGRRVEIRPKIIKRLLIKWKSGGEISYL